jgi:hypothetical protein
MSSFIIFTTQNMILVVKLGRMRWLGHAARVEKKRYEYWVLVGKPEGKKPLGKPTHRWQDGLS